MHETGPVRRLHCFTAAQTHCRRPALALPALSCSGGRHWPPETNSLHVLIAIQAHSLQNLGLWLVCRARHWGRRRT